MSLPEDILGILAGHSVNMSIVSKFFYNFWRSKSLTIDSSADSLVNMTYEYLNTIKILKINEIKLNFSRIIPTFGSEASKKLCYLFSKIEYLHAFPLIIMHSPVEITNLRLVDLQNNYSNRILDKFQKKGVECRNFRLSVTNWIDGVVEKYITPEQTKLLKKFIRHRSYSAKRDLRELFVVEKNANGVTLSYSIGIVDDIFVLNGVRNLIIDNIVLTLDGVDKIVNTSGISDLETVKIIGHIDPEVLEYFKHSLPYVSFFYFLVF